MEQQTSPTPQQTLDELANLATSAGIQAQRSQISVASAALDPLAALPGAEQIQAGYGHTLREVLQQPLVWADTARRTAVFCQETFSPLFHERRFNSIAITGSGSSHYAAELAAPVVEAGLGLPVRAIPAGDILTHGAAVLPLPSPVLLISLARSGNSPESVAAVRVVMQEAPESLFLSITCNQHGQLATAYPGDERVHSHLLHPRTHDESLVMTSSFTSMALALLGLAKHAEIETFLSDVRRCCLATQQALPEMADTLAALPFENIRRALFLGGGCQFGAAREAALKLTEMTAGRVVSMPETFLGLRHGPMAAVDSSTLVVALLPPELRARRYALDLLSELQRKNLGCATVTIDNGVPSTQVPVATSSTPDALPASFAALLGVMAGQWIGFFACRHHQLRPDSPAETGVITRVVEPFPLYH